MPSEADGGGDQRDPDVELGVAEGAEHGREVRALRLVEVLEAQRHSRAPSESAPVLGRLANPATMAMPLRM